MSGPIDIDEQGQEMYKVERILDDKFVDGRPFYLVKWEGWPDDANTWEPKENFDQNLVNDYLEAKRKTRQQVRHGERRYSPPRAAATHHSQPRFNIDRNSRIIGDDIINHIIHFRVKNSKGDVGNVPQSEVPAELVDDYYLRRSEHVPPPNHSEKPFHRPLLEKRNRVSPPREQPKEVERKQNSRNEPRDPRPFPLKFNPNLIKPIGKRNNIAESTTSEQKNNMSSPFYFLSTNRLESLVAAPKVASESSNGFADRPTNGEPLFEPYLPDNLSDEEPEPVLKKNEKSEAKRRGTFNKDKPVMITNFMYDIFQTQNMFVLVKWAARNGQLPHPTWINVVEANKKVPKLLAQFYIRMIKRHPSLGKLLELLTFADRREKFSQRYLRKPKA